MSWILRGTTPPPPPRSPRPTIPAIADDDRDQRAREFSRRELLRAGWSLPIALSVGGVAAACGGDEPRASAHADRPSLPLPERTRSTRQPATTTTTHVDVHDDHEDVHADRPPHADHTDTPHDDHQDTPHDDHDDHADVHNDLPPVTPPHADAHDDAVPHDDQGLPHDDAHEDVPHQDHSDAHQDHNDIHQDV